MNRYAPSAHLLAAVQCTASIPRVTLKWEEAGENGHASVTKEVNRKPALGSRNGRRSIRSVRARRGPAGAGRRKGARGSQGPDVDAGASVGRQPHGPSANRWRIPANNPYQSCRPTQHRPRTHRKSSECSHANAATCEGSRLRCHHPRSQDTSTLMDAGRHPSIPHQTRLRLNGTTTTTATVAFTATAPVSLRSPCNWTPTTPCAKTPEGGRQHGVSSEGALCHHRHNPLPHRSLPTRPCAPAAAATRQHGVSSGAAVSHDRHRPPPHTSLPTRPCAPAAAATRRHGFSLAAAL